MRRLLMLPKITYGQLMKELDKYRPNRVSGDYTKQQDEFILKCRDSKNPVSFNKMTELWTKLGWSKISKSALRLRWYKLKQ